MTDDDRQPWAGPSRSQRKRDAEAVRKLGERLTHLPDAELTALPLDDEVREAIAECQRLKKGARLRQLRVLASLLRASDLDALKQAMGEVEGVHAARVAIDQQAEAWRTRLLEEGDAALAELLDQHPGADGQRIRQLARAARRESEKAPDAAAAKRTRRELLRALRQLG